MEPSEKRQSAKEVIKALPPEAWRTITWRRGTKGPLSGKFVAVQVRPADGPWMSRNRRLPGREVWLVCEKRANGEIKSYLGEPLRSHVALDAGAADQEPLEL